jgi:hypothetical protein
MLIAMGIGVRRCCHGLYPSVVLVRPGQVNTHIFII